jgi:hypothetical protein
MVRSLQTACDKTGRNIFRDNVRTFWQLIEACWGISTVTYTKSNHLKNNFLFAFARVLSNHPIFWRDSRLFIERTLAQKIKLFKVNDPAMNEIVGGGSSVGQAVMYRLIVDHINSGKRTKRLVARVSDDDVADEMTIEDQGE